MPARDSGGRRRDEGGGGIGAGTVRFEGDEGDDGTAIPFPRAGLGCVRPKGSPGGSVIGPAHAVVPNRLQPLVGDGGVGIDGHRLHAVVAEPGVAQVSELRKEARASGDLSRIVLFAMAHVDPKEVAE